jgi:hypothetical protein
VHFIPYVAWTKVDIRAWTGIEVKKNSISGGIQNYPLKPDSMKMTSFQQTFDNLGSPISPEKNLSLLFAYRHSAKTKRWGGLPTDTV